MDVYTVDKVAVGIGRTPIFRFGDTKDPFRYGEQLR